MTPDIGSLGVNEGLQVTVEFKPLQAMDYTGTLLLSYNTGKDMLKVQAKPWIFTQ